MTRALPWMLALLAPLPAIAVGAGVAASQGVPWTAYVPNLLGVAAGMAVAAWARRRGPDAVSRPMIVAATLGIAATLVFPGVEGVHRWVSIGPVRLNASAALSPWLFIGLLASGGRVCAMSRAALLLVQVVHVLQPDAGQATALAAGAMPLLIAGTETPKRYALALSLIGLASVAWFRADPLAPVAHVEGTLVMATSMGALWTIVLLTAAACLLLPLMHGRSRTTWAVLCYLCAAFVVTLPGHFPVPVFGAGAGPVLGYYVLLILSRRDDLERDHSP